MSRGVIELIGRFFVVIGVALGCYSGYILYEMLFSLTGVDSSSQELNDNWIYSVIGLVFILGGLVVGALLFCLIWYILASRLFGVTRYDMELAIAHVAKKDPRENIAILQKYYKWCLDIAYK